MDKLEKYLCLKESDVVIPDGDVESSSDDDEEDDDDDDDDGNEDGDDDEDEEELEEAEEGAGGAGVNAEIQRDEADEEDNVEFAAKNREEDQQTDEFENQVNLVDEKSNLSKVSYTYISLNAREIVKHLLSRMNFALRQQLSWAYRKMPHVHQRIFKALLYRERHWPCFTLVHVSTTSNLCITFL